MKTNSHYITLNYIQYTIQLQYPINIHRLKNISSYDFQMKNNARLWNDNIFVFNYYRMNMDATFKREKPPNPRSKANLFEIITYR